MTIMHHHRNTLYLARGLRFLFVCLLVSVASLLGSEHGFVPFAAARSDSRYIARGAPLPACLQKSKILASSAMKVISPMGVPRGGAGSMIPTLNNRPTKKCLDQTPLSLNCAHAACPQNKNTSIELADSILRGGDIIPRAKRGWAISFGLSVIYLLIFAFYQPANPCIVSEAGFCVTNFQPETQTCPDLVKNSHFWAFGEDMIFFLVSIAIGIQQGTDLPTLAGSALAILFHGILHGYIAIKKCAATGGDGLIFYGLFTAFIAFFTVDIFGSLSFKDNVIITTLVTAITVYLTLAEPAKGVAAIFLTTQLLVSATALFFPANGKKLTSKTGDFFTLPCLVSIFEVLFCCLPSGQPSWFNAIGGHAWYDFFLHLSILVSLLPDYPDEE